MHNALLRPITTTVTLLRNWPLLHLVPDHHQHHQTHQRHHHQAHRMVTTCGFTNLSLDEKGEQLQQKRSHTTANRGSDSSDSSDLWLQNYAKCASYAKKKIYTQAPRGKIMQNYAFGDPPPRL